MQNEKEKFLFKIYWTINMFENEVRIENLRMNINVYLLDFELVKILAQAGLFTRSLIMVARALIQILQYESQSRLFLSSSALFRRY